MYRLPFESVLAGMEVAEALLQEHNEERLDGSLEEPTPFEFLEQEAEEDREAA